MLINHDFTQDRSKYLGGSDIGAVLGVSPFRTALEVWLEKTGKTVQSVDSLPVRFGSFAEAFVASEYARATGFQLIHDETMRVHSQYPQMAAHIDRFVLSSNLLQVPDRLLECKTANPYRTAEWGEIGTDQVPMSYLCQCLWYMAITGIEQTDLAVLFGNSDFRIYAITRDPSLEELIIQKALAFWNDYVLKDQPPPSQTEGDCQILFRQSNPTLQRKANPTILAHVQRYHVISKELEEREHEIAAIKQIIMNHMGEAEVLNDQGQVIATWKAPKASARLDIKQLERDHPDICRRYQLTTSSSRRLLIKPLIQKPSSLTKVHA